MLPFVDDGAGGAGDSLYFSAGEDGSLWAPLLEKALAKDYGNYQRLELKTRQQDVLQSLARTVGKAQTIDTTDATELWNWLQAEAAAGNFIIVQTVN